ncbi:hypothetical protein Q9L58_002579 [Maublancomyces gigas]|uniref:DUF2415 domain-containing protein n=1 Tax=Discina gigas TaxID=1032678 RepID=A0ABR3GR94_9PEZI
MPQYHLTVNISSSLEIFPRSTSTTLPLLLVRVLELLAQELEKQVVNPPWDLLIWAEHSGRVCVADARSNFRKRQVVDILVEKDDLIEAEVMSVDGDDDTQHSWRRREGSADRRYTREEEESEEDAAAASGDDVHALFSRRFGELSELVSRVRGNSHECTPALLRDYRERQIERERARQRIHDPPRRRNSTHPSYADQLVSAASVSTRLPVPVPTPSAPPMPESNPPSQRLSWNTSSEPRSSASRPLDVIFTEHQRNREQLSALIAEERRRTYIRRRANGGSAASADVVDDGGAGYRDDGDGVDITGCTLSLDGSKLYVATDGGIVEYHVDIAGRKVFPSFTPR